MTSAIPQTLTMLNRLRTLGERLRQIRRRTATSENAGPPGEGVLSAGQKRTEAPVPVEIQKRMLRNIRKTLRHRPPSSLSSDKDHDTGA